jgi:hypothetical protein
MEIEWVALCQDVQEGNGNRLILNLGTNGMLIDGPRPVTLGLIVCVLGHDSDKDGDQIVIRYRVLGPDRTQVDCGESGLERWTDSAPKTLDVERYLKTIWIDFDVAGPGVFNIDVDISPSKTVRLPLWFVVLPSVA